MGKIKKMLFFFGTIFSDVWDRMTMTALKCAELLKFQDKRRKDIYRSFTIDKIQKAEIENFYRDNYGKKISIMWHKYYSSYTGKCDYRFFPEIFYIPEFERFMNDDNCYVKAFSDKNVTPLFASFVGIKTPDVVISSTNGVLRDQSYRIITKNEAISLINNTGRFFYKPTVDSDSGRGCRLVEFENGIDVFEGLEIERVFENKFDNWAIQKIVRCSDSLRCLSPNSVNTFRIMTYIWKGKVYSTPSVLRIGRSGSYLDNAHAGGIFVAIDDDGTLHEEAFSEFQERYYEHPDTNTVFKGYKINEFPLVLSAAKRMHEIIPQIGAINWDFTLNEKNEPLLIEANTSKGGIWLFQMAHGKGPFGDNTEDILLWLKNEKKKPKSKRKKPLSTI